ncbi:MAG: tetratricopeptide repeat protein [Bacteroidetes bacterium]|nr:tetratricopeptide repeat protein [Bacteroidota bacterium]
MLAILGGILVAGSISAQTLTDVINEFNEGVSNVNNQEYDASLEHFNQVLTLAEAVGDSAAEMKANAEKLIPASYYKQAMMFLKRKQYDNAIPYLENTIETATQFDNNAESKGKASRYLMQSYVREAQRNYKNKSFDESLSLYDKSLAMNENLYQAHLGKGMVYRDMDEIESMLKEFAVAKEGALAKNDTKTIGTINKAVDGYFNTIIKDEFDAIDSEQPEYEYVVEACENALNANPDNARAHYYLASVHNKNGEFDKAIESGLKGLASETESVWISALNFELGNAYQNNAEYDLACETLKKVMDEPFLTKAEKKMGSIPGCN